MRIEITRKGVMEDIYALSALQGYVELPERERALLQEDQEEGLAVLVADAFAEVVLELMPRVAEIGMPEDSDSGDMWIELKETYGDNAVVSTTITALIAKVIANMVVGAIYEGSVAGKKCNKRALTGIASIRELIDSYSSEMLRIKGWR